MNRIHVLLGIAAFVGACERASVATSTSVTRSPSTVSHADARLQLAAILERLAATDRSGDELELEQHAWTARASGSCEELGFPAKLPANVAGRADALAPGAGLTLVDRGGATPIVVRELGCTAPGDLDPPTVVVRFAAARPLSQPPTSARMVERAPTELVVAGAVHPDARLRAPSAVDLATAADIRATVVEILARSAPDCDGLESERDENASVAWASSVIASARAWRIEARPHALLFVVFENTCPGYTPAIGMLVDPNTGTREAEVEASAGVEIDALVDLDGDGTDEVLLHLTYMEDGGEDLELLVRRDDAWDTVPLWSAATP